MTAVFSPQDFERAVEALGAVPKISIRCPDQYVGDVEWQPGGFAFRGDAFTHRFDLDYGISKIQRKRLIIVLESPHTHEYDLEACSAIGPANGQTGQRIRKFLQPATREFSNFCRLTSGDEYALVLMNAVSYQCSLGRRLHEAGVRKLRDRVFRSCWEKKGKPDFTDRISAYWNEQSLLINACTKGQAKGCREKWLREMVEDVVDSCGVPFTARCRRCHPISPYWSAGKGWKFTYSQ